MRQTKDWTSPKGQHLGFWTWEKQASWGVKRKWLASGNSPFGLSKLNRKFSRQNQENAKRKKATAPCSPRTPHASRALQGTPGALRTGCRLRIDPDDKTPEYVSTWVRLKIKPEGLRRFWSMFPLTRVPVWYRLFEPQPNRETPQKGSGVRCPFVFPVHQGTDTQFDTPFLGSWAQSWMPQGW